MKVKLSEIAEIKGGKRIPKGGKLQTAKNTHPYLRITDFDGSRFNKEKIEYVPNEIFEKISKYTIQKNNIFLSIVGTIGIVTVIGKEFDGASLTENAVKIIPNNRLVNTVFLSYYLKSSKGQFEINRLSVGTTQKKLPIKNIKKIMVTLPKLEVQNQIAEKISLIDDKININTKINDNLINLSQIIFNDLFPDVHSGKDNIGELVNNFDRFRKPISKNNRNLIPGKYRYIGATGILDYISKYNFNGIYLLLGEDGSVIDESNHPILQYVFGKFWPNNHTHVLQGNRVSTEWLYLYFRTSNVKSLITGAVQLKISQSNLNSLNLTIPTNQQLSKFDNKVQSIFAKIRSNEKENLELKELKKQLYKQLF